MCQTSSFIYPRLKTNFTKCGKPLDGFVRAVRSTTLADYVLASLAGHVPRKQIPAKGTRGRPRVRLTNALALGPTLDALLITFPNPPSTAEYTNTSTPHKLRPRPGLVARRSTLGWYEAQAARPGLSAYPVPGRHVPRLNIPNAWRLRLWGPLSLTPMEEVRFLRGDGHHT